nr:integrase, catalytic region, zinc finger, CCHC-type, peptidase aspartic, catalytic [Tanacetum cinerariifolium]
MLEKDMYDSWKSRMELYMMNIQHERMILEFVENGPLIWPLIEENRVTRPKKYSELSATKAIQADCNVNATNIILQGLPPDVYQGDDPIDAINHMMSFLSAVITSRYPTTNNQLRNSLNPRQQATINDGIITLQPVQGRQISLALGKGHMSKQCTKPKRKQDDSWFKDKVLLVQAQANGQILHEEELAFLADPGIREDALSEVHNPDNVDINMINQAMQAMPSSKQSNAVNHSETKITSNSNIIPYSHVNDTLTAELERYKEQVKVLKEGQNVALKSKDNISDLCAQSVEIDHLKQTLLEHLKEKKSLMQTVTLLKNDFKKEEYRNIDREISLEKRIKQLDNIVFKRDQSAQTVYMLMKPQFFYDHTTKQALVISKDIVNKIVNSFVDTASVNVHECEKFLKLETELLNKKDFVEKEIYDKLFRNYTTLEKYCISLEVDTQLNQEIFQRDNSVSNQSALSFDHYFKLNELNGQSQKKDMVIKKLKERIKSLSGNACPLTRITTTTKMPTRKPVALVTDTHKPVVTLVYSRKPRKSKSTDPNSKSKVINLLSKLFSGIWTSCSKHMTGDSSQLTNFVNKFLGIIKFGNDHVVKIMGYGDYQIGNVTILRVYYVEGLVHNLFSVGQFCDSNLEVAFRQHTFYIRNLEGVDLLTGSWGNNMYTLSLRDMMMSSPICLL